MITKTQAIAIRNSFISSFESRLDAAIVAAATNGGTSVTISYLPDSDANATNFLNTKVIPAGWSTSSIDTSAKTITVAP